MSMHAIASLQYLVLPLVVGFLVAIATPPGVVSGAAQITAAPAGKHGTIYGATFRVLEQAVASISVLRVYAQNFDRSNIGIDAKRRIIHTERSIPACEFLQS